MTTKYEEEIKKLFINIINKDEQEINKIEKLPQEMKWQIGSEISHLLMSYVALIDEKEETSKRGVEVEEIITFSNNIVPDLKLKMYEDVYLYNRFVFLSKKIEREMKVYEKNTVREIPFNKILGCAEEFIKIYESVNKYIKYDIDKFIEQQSEFKYVTYNTDSSLEKVGNFICDISEVLFAMKNEDETNIRVKNIIENFYNECDINEEKKYDAYFNEKKFKNKNQGIKSEEMKELIKNHFIEQKKELMKLIEVSSNNNNNDIIFFNWLSSLNKIKLERDLEDVFRKHPDRDNIFESIGKEIYNYLKEKRVEYDFNQLNQEIDIQKNEINIKIKGKI